MYIHMFAFRMKPGVTPEQKQRMLREIRALATQIPEILESWVGMNESPRAEGYELGGAMRFANKESFESYGTHPAHQKLISWLMPLIEPVEIDFPG
jgi:antibiotic biosynthesis monooxygenase (ABM) superfamily enzyme